MNISWSQGTQLSVINIRNSIHIECTVTKCSIVFFEQWASPITLVSMLAPEHLCNIYGPFYNLAIVFSFHAFYGLESITTKETLFFKDINNSGSNLRNSTYSPKVGNVMF